MNNGRYSKRSPARKRKLSKQFVMLLSVVLVLSAVVGGTVAYLTAQSEKVENTFTPGVVDCVVVKSGVGYVVQNKDGNTDAMIRVAVVVNSIDSNGNTYYKNPTYTVAGWGDANADGYYYYSSAVAPGGQTGEFTVSVTPVEGYAYEVEILAQAIQAGGGAGWGVVPSGN